MEGGTPVSFYRDKNCFVGYDLEWGKNNKDKRPGIINSKDGAIEAQRKLEWDLELKFYLILKSEFGHY